MSDGIAYIVIHNQDGTESEPITSGNGMIADFSDMQNIKVSSKYIRLKIVTRMTQFNLQALLHMDDAVLFSTSSKCLKIKKVIFRVNFIFY